MFAEGAENEVVASVGHEQTQNTGEKMAKNIQTVEIVKVNFDQKSQGALLKESESLVPQLQITIRTQAQLDHAVAMTRVGDAWLEKWFELTDPVKEATNQAHKAAVKMQNDGARVISDKLKILRAGISKFLADVEAERIREQNEADAEQRRLNQEEADRVAKLAKKSGADKETVAEIKEQVLATPAPIVRQAYVPPANTSTVTRWDIDRENYDLYELCLAIVKFPKAGNHLLTLIEPNFVNLKSRATEGKENAVIPGFKVKKLVGVAIR
jgi:hypothetical protein